MKTAEDIMKEKTINEIISVGKDAVVQEGIEKMVENKIGAILIKENEKITGIWTERDLLRNMVKEGFDPKTALIRDYMVTELRSAPYNDNLYMLMDKFLSLKLRHLLIEKNNEYIGFLSIGDVIMTNLREKCSELEDLGSYASLKICEIDEQAGGKPSEKTPVVSFEDRFSYDEKKNVLYVNLAGHSVKNHEDIGKIEFMVASILSPVDKKVYAIVNYEDFAVSADIVNEYVTMITRLSERFYLDVTRYTKSAELRNQLDVALRRQRIQPHLFGTSEEAYSEIAKLL